VEFVVNSTNTPGTTLEIEACKLHLNRASNVYNKQLDTHNLHMLECLDILHLKGKFPFNHTNNEALKLLSS